MSKSKSSAALACALSVILLASSLSACREPAKKKLPVCPGDPRCEVQLR